MDFKIKTLGEKVENIENRIDQVELEVDIDEDGRVGMLIDLDNGRKTLLAQLEDVKRSRDIIKNRVKNILSNATVVFLTFSATGIVVDLTQKRYSMVERDFKNGVIYVIMLYMVVILSLYEKIKLDREKEDIVCAQKIK